MRLLPTDTSRGVTDMVLAKEKETRHMMRHWLISFMAACATALCAAAGGSPLDEYLLFETVGDDCYADGSPLWEGECYALVWRNGDAATRVDGLFNSDGTVANPSTTKILAVFPAAVQTNYEGGVYSCARRSWALMNPMDMAMWENRGGVLSLFVFDTRRWNTESQAWELSGCDVEEKTIAAIRRYGLVTDLEDIQRGLYIGIFEWDTYVHGTSFVTSDELALFGDVTDQYSGTTNRAVGVSGESVISFDSNGGGPVPPTMRMADGPCGALPGSVRTGYVFAGWFTARTGGEKISSDTVVTDDVTYYAQWEPIHYTVVFNPNGGEGEKTEQDFVYDQAQALKENGFTRDGHVFAYWTNSVGRIFGNCVEVSNLTDVPYGKVELYAVWREGDDQEVTFDACGGVVMEQRRVVKTQQKIGKLPTAERTGYTFAGWFMAAVGGAEVTAETVATADIFCFAHWTPVVYPITYDLDGGVNAATNPATYTIESPDIKLAAPTRKGYVFAGWMPTDLIPTGSTGAKAFTATWKAVLFDSPAAEAINPKGAAYNGFLGSDEAFGGTFTLVVKKPKKNQTVADATLTWVDPLTGKKVKVSGKVDTETGLGAGDLAGLVLNEKGVGGTVQINNDNVQVQGAVDAVKAKDQDALAVMNDFNKSVYGLVLDGAEGEVAYLTATFSAKGKVKVAGSYRGAKVSGSARMSVGDELCAVPFAWSKKGVAVSFVLWFDKAGLLIDVTGLGTDVTVRAAGSAEVWAPNYVFALDEGAVRASVSDAIKDTFDPLAVSFNGKKFDTGKAAKVSYKKGVLEVNRDKGDNVTGLKLTYSKGALKGSFTVYAVSPADKLVKNKFAVVGVMVDGEIHAAGTSKNLKSIPLTLTK